MFDSDVQDNESQSGDKETVGPEAGGSAPGDEPASSPSFDPAVDFINSTVASISTSQDEAMGKVYQAVSQSMALAVQDGTDNLRNFSTVNLAALSYAQEQLVATKDAKTWAPIIADLQTALTTQIAAFNTLGTDAASILQTFMKETPAVSSTASPSLKSSGDGESSVLPSSVLEEGPSDQNGFVDTISEGSSNTSNGTYGNGSFFLKRFFHSNKQGEK